MKIKLGKFEHFASPLYFTIQSSWRSDKIYIVAYFDCECSRLHSHQSLGYIKRNKVDILERDYDGFFKAYNSDQCQKYLLLL